MIKKNNNKQINKVKRDFLKVLVNNDGRWHWTLSGLDRRLGEPRDILVHVAHLLEDDKKIKKLGEVESQIIYEITSLGREIFDPWYIKTWRFFTTDMSKILSVVAITLSIITSIVGLWFHLHNS